MKSVNKDEELNQKFDRVNDALTRRRQEVESLMGMVNLKPSSPPPRRNRTYIDSFGHRREPRYSPPRSTRDRDYHQYDSRYDSRPPERRDRETDDQLKRYSSQLKSIQKEQENLGHEVESKIETAKKKLMDQFERSQNQVKQKIDRKLDDLRGKITGMQNSRKEPDLKEKIGELENDNLITKMKIDDFGLKFDGFLSEQKKAASELKRLEDGLLTMKKKEPEIENGIRDVVNLSQRVGKLENQQVKGNNEIGSTNQNLDEIKGLVKIVNSRVKSIEDHNADLSNNDEKILNELNRIDEENANIKKNFEGMFTKNSKLEQLLKENISKADALTDVCGTNSERVERVERTQDAVANSLGTIQQANETRHNSIMDLISTQDENFNNIRKGLGKRVEEVKDEVESVKIELGKDIDQVREEMNEKGGKFEEIDQNLNNKIENEIQKIEALRKKDLIMENKLKNCELRNEGLGKDLFSVKNELDGYGRKMKEIDVGLKRGLKNETLKIRKEINENNSEISKKLDELETKNVGVEEKLSNIRTDLVEYEGKFDDIDFKFKKMFNDESRKTKEEFHKKNSGIVKKLQVMGEQSEGVDEKMSGLRTDLFHCEGKIEELNENLNDRIVSESSKLKEEMNEKTSAIEKKVEESISANEQLGEEISNLQSELQECDAKVDAVDKGTREIIFNETLKLRKEMKENNDKLEKEVDDCSSQNKNVGEVLSDLQNDLVQLNEKVGGVEKKNFENIANESQKIREEFIQKNVDLEKKIENAVNDYTEKIQGSQITHEKFNDETRKTKEELFQRSDGIEEKIQVMGAQTEGVDEKLSNLRTDLLECEGKVEELNDRVAVENQKVREEMREKNCDLEKKIDEITSKNENLEGELSKFKSEIQDYGGRIEEIDKGMKENLLSEVQKIDEEMNTKTEEIEKKVEDVSVQNEGLGEEVSNLKTEFQEFGNKIEDVDKGMKEIIISENQKLREEMNGKDNEIEKKVDEVSLKNEGIGEEMTNLRTELLKCGEKIEEIEQDNKENLITESQKIQEEMIKMNSEIEKQLKNFSAQNEGVEEELSNIRNNLVVEIDEKFSGVEKNLNENVTNEGNKIREEFSKKDGELEEKIDNVVIDYTDKFSETQMTHECFQEKFEQLEKREREGRENLMGLLRKHQEGFESFVRAHTGELSQKQMENFNLAETNESLKKEQEKLSQERDDEIRRKQEEMSGYFEDKIQKLQDETNEKIESQDELFKNYEAIRSELAKRVSVNEKSIAGNLEEMNRQHREFGESYRMLVNENESLRESNEKFSELLEDQRARFEEQNGEIEKIRKTLSEMGSKMLEANGKEIKHDEAIEDLQRQFEEVKDGFENRFVSQGRNFEKDLLDSELRMTKELIGRVDQQREEILVDVAGKLLTMEKDRLEDNSEKDRNFDEKLNKFKDRVVAPQIDRLSRKIDNHSESLAKKVDDVSFAEKEKGDEDLKMKVEEIAQKVKDFDITPEQLEDLKKIQDNLFRLEKIQKKRLKKNTGKLSVKYIVFIVVLVYLFVVISVFFLDFLYPTQFYWRFVQPS